MAINSNDIKMYLTSLEPDIAQNTYSQSIGGYPSTSLVYPENVLLSSSDLYQSSMDVSLLNECDYVSTNSELMGIETINENSIVIERNKLGKNKFHKTGDIVRLINVDNLFNKSFNKDNKQYRCIAIKNTSLNQIAYNFTIYMTVASISLGSKVKIAIEVPKNDSLINRVSTGGSTSTLVDSGLISSYEDNHFKNSLLRIKSGSNNNQTRIISSFDNETGTFVLQDSLNSSIINGITYSVDPSPCQRLRFGTDCPDFTINRITKPSIVGYDSRISININRDHGANMAAGDIIYVWIERTILPGYSPTDLNGIFFACNYYTSLS